METVRLGIGLLLLVSINILLGAAHAALHQIFNGEKFKQGLIKASIIILCFALTYLVGLLNPSIASVQINGMEVDVLTALHMVVLAGYYHYAKQVIEKLATLLAGGNGA